MTSDKSARNATASPANRLTRRTLLRATGFGIGAFTLASCDTNEASQDDEQEPTRGKASGLSVGFFAVNSHFDPATSYVIEPININRLVYRTLYRHELSPPHDLVPDLAIDFPNQIGDTTFRITLNDDATFHDGTPLTADDVVFTYEHYTDPDIISLFPRYLDPIIEGINATSDHEIEVTLSNPTTLLADRLALLQIISRNAVTKSPAALELEPIGSGPYMVRSAASQETVILQNFPDYAGDGNFAFEEVEFTSVSADSARLAGLYSGRFDVIGVPPDSAFEELQASANVSVEAVPGKEYTYILFNSADPPFNDVRMRQAVLYAIDRDAITQASFFGNAEAAWEGQITPEDPDYTPTEIIYRYDPDHAKQLIIDAGYGDEVVQVELGSVPFDFITSQLPIIQENLREVGFEVTIKPDAQVPEGDFDLFVQRADASVFAPDAELRLRWLYYGDIFRDQTRLDDESANRIEEALDEAFTAPDVDTRRESLAKAHNLIQELAARAPLHRRHNLTAWSDELQGYKALPVVGVDLNGLHK